MFVRVCVCVCGGGYWWQDAVPPYTGLICAPHPPPRELLRTGSKFCNSYCVSRVRRRIAVSTGVAFTAQCSCTLYVKPVYPIFWLNVCLHPTLFICSLYRCANGSHDVSFIVGLYSDSSTCNILVRNTVFYS